MEKNEFIIKLMEIGNNSVGQLLSLSSFKDVSNESIELYSQKMDSKRREFLSTHNIREMTEDSPTLLKIRYKINVTHSRENISEFNNVVLKSIVIHACSIFDTFINKLLDLLYKRDTRILKSSKKQISYETLFSASSLEEIIQQIIEMEIHSQSYRNIKERVLQIRDTFGLKLNEIEDDPKFFVEEINLNALMEIFAVRNIIVHNGGIINKTFKTIVTDEKYRLNHLITIDEDMVWRAIFLCTVGCLNIATACEKKYDL